MQRILKNVSLYACLLLVVYSTTYGQAGDIPSEAVRLQIANTGKAVREAFKRGDVETIKKYHHPDVVKALGYNNLKVGREAVLDGLRETMANFDMEFLEGGKPEVFVQKGDVVIKQRVFSLKLIPKNGDVPFVFKGRTLLVLQRYDESPTGWATVHEMIQPYETPTN